MPLAACDSRSSNRNEARLPTWEGCHAIPGDGCPLSLYWEKRRPVKLEIAMAETPGAEIKSLFYIFSRSGLIALPLIFYGSVEELAWLLYDSLIAIYRKKRTDRGLKKLSLCVILCYALSYCFNFADLIRAVSSLTTWNCLTGVSSDPERGRKVSLQNFISCWIFSECEKMFARTELKPFETLCLFSVRYCIKITSHSDCKTLWKTCILFKYIPTLISEHTP